MSFVVNDYAARDTAGGSYASQSCQIVDTSGPYIQPSAGITPNGYTCAGCGLWVQHGVWHDCSAWRQQTITVWPSTWNWSTMPSITAFKGAVKALKDLPSDAGSGDTYYVTDAQALVVRQPGGWFHFDKK